MSNWTRNTTWTAEKIRPSFLKPAKSDRKTKTLFFRYSFCLLESVPNFAISEKLQEKEAIENKKNSKLSQARNLQLKNKKFAPEILNLSPRINAKLCWK